MQITKEDITKINGSNLFLALIEPKKLATKETIKSLERITNKDYLRKIMNQTLEEMGEREREETILEIQMQGEDEFIKEIQRNLYLVVEDAKNKRTKPIVATVTALTNIKGGIYDFQANAPFDSDEYYINYVSRFDEIFIDADWTIIYEDETPKIQLTEEGMGLLELFWQTHAGEIDEKAPQKIKQTSA